MISSSVIEFLLILGVHPPGGVADGWMGVGVGMGMWGVSHAHTHAHTCMHTHTCMLNMLIMLNMDASHVGGHLQFLYMYTCAYVRVHACMCMCGGTPPMPPDALTPPQPPAPSPEPQGAQNSKIQ